MFDDVAIGIAAGVVGRLTAGATGCHAEDAEPGCTLGSHRLECFTLGVLVGLFSTLPTILRGPSQLIGPALLAAIAIFTTFRREGTPARSRGMRFVLWGSRGLVGSLAAFAGWLVGSGVR